MHARTHTKQYQQMMLVLKVVMSMAEVKEINM